MTSRQDEFEPHLHDSDHDQSEEIQPCGHPMRMIHSTGGGTSYCEGCELEARGVAAERARIVEHCKRRHDFYTRLARKASRLGNDPRKYQHAAAAFKDVGAWIERGVQ